MLKTLPSVKEPTIRQQATRIVGHGVPRVDALAKATGAAKFLDDLQFGPGMLHAKLLRSPHPHARIISIDTRAAENMPGVKAVVTGREFPYRIGLYLVDRTLYAIDRVRFIGEPVAGVAAISKEIAEDACKRIKVEYEPLPALLDPVKAAAEKNVLIHENLGSYEHANFIFPQADSNIANHFRVRKGNTARAFADAHFTYEDEYTVPHIHHSPLETHAAVGLADATGKLTLWTSSQSPFAQRHLLAKSLGIPHGDLRVVAPYVGGGFGCKAGVSIEACVLPLAMKARGRPVKLFMTREEEFYSNFVRQGLRAKVKIGVDSNGRLLAMELGYYWAAGAYAEYGTNITRAAGYSCTGPYRVPNVKADSYCVYTNHPVGGPMRGFGMPEIHWALEQCMDEICHRTGMDQVEFKLKNVIKGGDSVCTGMEMHPTGLSDCVRKVAKEIGWNKPLAPSSGKTAAGARKPKRRGRGIAVMWKAPAMPPNAGSSAILKFNEDYTVDLAVSGMEIGQGTHTVMGQIAAEILGIKMSDIRVHGPDTELSPYEWQTVASRLTWSMGNAVKNAAWDARNQIVSLVARSWEVNPSEIDILNGFVFEKRGRRRKIALGEAAVLGMYLPDSKLHGGPVIGRGNFIPPDVTGLDKDTGQGPRAVVHYTTGCQAVEIEIDEETGQIEVLKVVAAYDCGRAINPLNVRMQMEGGAAMGMSTALFEELIFDNNGKLRNGNFTDYKIATALDIPMDLQSNIIECAQEDGPFGARGVGEHTMVPTAPAISNALRDALGVRIKSMPLTPEKVLKALREGPRL